MRRIGIMLCVAIPLAVTDLVVKVEEPTASWAYHQRSYGWLALSLALLVLMFVIAQIPSRFVAPAAGILAAGILGNSLSAAWNGMEVPNPLVIGGEHAFIAFNLADVWALSGIFILVCAIGAWLIHNRDLLPQTAEVRASRGAAFRRLFQGEKH